MDTHTANPKTIEAAIQAAQLEYVRLMAGKCNRYIHPSERPQHMDHQQRIIQRLEKIYETKTKGQEKSQ